MSAYAPVTTEKDVQAACLQWLNTVPGIRAWRQNTGVFIGSYKRKRDGITKTRRVKFGETSQGDIGGIGPVGVRIEIEVKRPGKYPDADQIAWMDFIRNHGGIAFWCDSLRMCVQHLRSEFEKRQWRWRVEWEVR